MGIKKTQLLLSAILCTVSSIAVCQGVYYPETGSGFSIGGSYTSRTTQGISVSTSSIEISTRVSKSVSVNLDYTSVSVLKENASALIPSLTLQTPGKNLINFAASVGYMKSRLSANVPSLLISFGLFMSLNRESIFQIFPSLSLSQTIHLKRSSYRPDPVIGVGTDLGLRLASNVFIVAGPQLQMSGGESQVVGSLGLVIQ